MQRSEGQGDGSQEIQTPKKVRKLQRTLYRKAKAEPGYRFWSLYGELARRDLLEHALKLVARNGGASGIDGQTVAQITATEASWQQWLGELQRGLQDQTCRPSPVRRVYIPKRNGGQRPLGIPTVKDRVVQMAALLVLGPIFEADFHPNSFGFRPRCNAHQALNAIIDANNYGWFNLHGQFRPTLLRTWGRGGELEVESCLHRTRCFGGDVAPGDNTTFLVRLVAMPEANQRRSAPLIGPVLASPRRGRCITRLPTCIWLS